MPGRAICFVCGNSGAETCVHVRPQDRGPYFPFLEHHDPPKGSRVPAADGSVDSCRVCYAFLTQQWETYERTKTPAIKRLYWLKRADNGSFTGAEMKYQGEYIAQVMGLQYAPGAFDEPGSPEGSNYLPEREYLRPSQKENSGTQYNIQQHLPEKTPHSIKDKALSQKQVLDGALDLSTSKPTETFNTIQHNSQLNKCIEGRNFTCLVCNQLQGKANCVYISVLKQPNNEPYFPMLEKIASAQGTEYVSGQTKVCIHCKNVLYQQWQAYEMSGTPVNLRTYKIPDELLAHVYSESSRSETNIDVKPIAVMSEFHCYICGFSNISDHARPLNTLPPKSPAPATMFFPFVRELKRPSGAEPLRSDGSVIVCVKCVGHLSYQWQIQECEGVPLYHRQYSLHFLSTGVAAVHPEGETNVKASPTEGAVRPLNIQISQASPVKSDRTSEPPNYLSAQGLLTIASRADPGSNTSRHSDPSYSATRGYDGVSDAKSVPGESTVTTVCKTVPHPLQQVSDIPKKTCFLCSEICIIHKMMLLYSYPSRHEAKHTSTGCEPFFPFLANINPVPNADPVSEDGTVIVCKLCYYTLLKQWKEYELSSDPVNSNRWLRKYSLPDYICYVCATSHERKFMRSLVASKFPFLSEQKAPNGSLIMDGGEMVAVCKSCAYSLMQQFAEYERMGVPPELRKYNWMNRSSVPDGALDEESQDERKYDYTTRLPTPDDKSKLKHEQERQEHGPAGAIHGSKPPPLNMLSPAGSKIQRNTATVSPLHHVTSPANGVNSGGTNAALNASRTSSFAAALRKLANQAKDPPDEPGQKSSSSTSPREPSTKPGPPPLVYTSTTLTSPPVVTIAPTQSHASMLATEPRPALERMHSSQSSSSIYDAVNMKMERERPQSSQSRDDERASSRDNHSHSNRRITPHSTPGAVSPMSTRDEGGGARGFQPYRPGDDMRTPFHASLALDPAAAAAAAAYTYPAAFLPPHAYPHPAFRFDDPLLLERYRMMQHPYLSYPAGMISHPGLHPLLAGGRYPSELLPHHLQLAAQAGRLPEHRSPLHTERQRLEEEKQREMEREREKEQEKERELALQRERQKAIERESEKQRERERSAAQRDREMERREPDRPKVEMTAREKSEESLAARFGSIIQGTPKGLGIADRYPRAPSGPNSAMMAERREETKGIKEEYSNPQIGSSFARPQSSHKGFAEDKKFSESEKRYSLVNPMRESDHSRRLPLTPSKPRDDAQLRTHRSPEANLFRPFDSKHIPNGYSELASERDKLFHYHGNDEQKHSHGKDPPQTADRKPTIPVRKEEESFPSSHGSKFGSSASAFHALDNRVSNSQLAKPRSDPQSLHSSSHLATCKREMPDPHQAPTYQGSYQTPLNVPSYHTSSPIDASDAISSKLLTESPTWVSKLDIEERKMSESRSNGSYCSDSDCDMDSEEDSQQRGLLIASGPPLHLDTSPRKMKLLTKLGLTTQRHKKDKEFEHQRKRRRRMREQSVSPVSLEENTAESVTLHTPYNPADLCREPDYMLKCHFLLQFYHLQPVSRETRKANTAIQQACEAERNRRKLVTSEGETTVSGTTVSGVKRKHEMDHDADTTATSNNFPNRDSSLETCSGHDLRLYNVDHLQKPLNSEADKRSKDHRDGSAMLNLPSKLGKDFVQDFHDSVLQTTRQKELAQRLGHLADVQKPDRAGRHSQGAAPVGSAYPYHPGRQLWTGVDAVMESYQQHQQGEKLETHILLERNKKLRASNAELNKTAQHLSHTMEELLKNKQQLEDLRYHNQARIDGLKSTMKKLRKS